MCIRLPRWWPWTTSPTQSSFLRQCCEVPSSWRCDEAQPPGGHLSPAAAGFRLRAGFFPFAITPTAPLTEQPPASATPSPVPAETSTSAAPLTPEPLTLRLWLPPQFDPNGTSAASLVLKQRLDEYTAAHEDIHLDIRIKGRQDPESLLETLSLTRSAAPGALPDLVALPRADVEAAALKGTLHPLEGISEELDSPDWYPYAREAGHVQNSIYGLPFAGTRWPSPTIPHSSGSRPLHGMSCSRGRSRWHCWRAIRTACSCSICISPPAARCWTVPTGRIWRSSRWSTRCSLLQGVRLCAAPIRGSRLARLYGWPHQHGADMGLPTAG